MADGRRLVPTRDGRVLTVTFNNPPRHFFDEQMSIELDDLTRRLRRDASLGAVVFTGQDATYVTHFDVPDLLRGARRAPFPVPYGLARVIAGGGRLAGRSRTLDLALRGTPAGDAFLMARVYASLRRLNRMDKVVVTAVNGLAFGMGCVFALACDVRLMAAGQQIGLTESSLAMLAGAGGTQRMVRMVGAGRALELLLEGRWLDATEAADLGLVHRVVAPEDLQAEAHAVAERMARRSPVINREIKRMVYDAGTRPFPAALRREAASVVTTMASHEAEAALSTYLTSLRRHDPPTDADIKSSLGALADTGHRSPLGPSGQQG
jgi:enoyl-CoA hydratase